jgi:hydroxyacylglutathione hydrolase
MRVRTLATPELGDRSYVVDDGTTSLVIDPQRDLDRLEPLLEHDVAYVLETHVHNDYVTGGLELARRTGAAYGVNAADPVSFAREGLADGDVLSVGSLSVRVVATPGHTPTHLSYVVTPADGPPAVFSGGSLLYGSVGRTDLVAPELTRALAGDQLRSVHRLSSFPAESALFPTHGFGSFCAGGPTSGADTSTIGQELEKNPALRAAHLRDFVDELVASYTSYPAYYAHMAPLNRSGPGAVELTSPLPVADLPALLASGAAVVDLRTAPEFAAGHLPGTLSVNLGTQFATYVGWLTPWGAPLALVAGSTEELDDARRQLARIGITDLSAAPPATTGLSSYRRATFDELADELVEGDVLLDVRRSDEYDAEHVQGAIHLPLHTVADRLAEVPTDARVWVYCAGGFRAGTAASILERHVAEVVHVDDAFSRAVELGLTR